MKRVQGMFRNYIHQYSFPLLHSVKVCVINEFMNKEKFVK